MRSLRMLAVAGAVVAAGACGQMQQQRQPGPTPSASSEARVQVTNNNWSDMTVYASRGSSRVRLGTVTSMTKQTMALPRGIVDSGSDFRLVVSPIGADDIFATGSLSILPGQTVEFRIENHLAISSISVW